MQKCPRCKEKKDDVKRREDPYASDVLGLKKIKLMCGECEKALADDI